MMAFFRLRNLQNLPGICQRIKALQVKGALDLTANEIYNIIPVNWFEARNSKPEEQNFRLKTLW